MGGRDLENIISGKAIRSLDRVSHTCAAKEVANNAQVLLFGNRVTVFGATCVAAYYSLLEIVPPESQAIAAVLMTPVNMFGSMLLGITMLGTATYQHYRRAAEHIRIHGTLSPKYAETVIRGSENGKYIGYCQQQGLYLAAKKHHQIQVFEAARKEHSRIRIPFF